LSYGLPILQRLLEERRDEYNEQQQQQQQQELCTMKEVDETHTNNNKTTNINGKIIGNIDSSKRVLRALILVPTRELAIQVEAELLKVCLRSIGIRTIVGGFAEMKQRRVLEKERPAIVVATPGRLWELVRIIYLSHSFLYIYIIFLFSPWDRG
jgi:ATP-dependent RNA helicase DDX24/MAK5